MAETVTKSPNAVFPSPLDRPNAPYILIYDGHCRFCRANIAGVAAIDRGKVAYLSLHDVEVQKRWPDLTYDQLMERMYLVDLATGDKHGGAAAFRFLSRKLPALWIFAPLMHIPGSLPLWQFLYSRIARIRYKFGRIEECENGSCSLHFD